MGSHGRHVEGLQRLLNAHLTPSPNLRVDGLFGPKTRDAVIHYQSGAGVAADGVVGRHTWFELAKGARAAVAPHAISVVTSTDARPYPRPEVVEETTDAVWELPLQEKFERVLRLTPPKLPCSMRAQLEAFLSPTNITIMAGTLVVWAGSHAFGAGEIVDILLLGVGLFFMGMAVFDAVDELGDFLSGTVAAHTEKDLDKAATHLANALVLIGVLAFIALLEKVGRAKGGKEIEGRPGVREPEPRPKGAEPEPRQGQPEPKSEPAKAANRPRDPRLRKDLNEKWINEDGSIKWPENDGFAGPTEPTTLEPGTKIDRYGKPGGTFSSPAETPYEARSLPYEQAQMEHHTYEVVKPLPVEAGEVAPSFDQPGGGTQYKTGAPIEKLIEDGYLREVPN